MRIKVINKIVSYERYVFLSAFFHFYIVENTVEDTNLKSRFIVKSRTMVGTDSVPAIQAKPARLLYLFTT